MQDKDMTFRLDYEIISSLEEWQNGKYKTTPNFYRLKIFTDGIQEFLKEKTGKTVPIGPNIKLDAEEEKSLYKLITGEKRFCGTFGALRAKAFDLDCFYIEGKDGLATEQEVAYDYTWEEL